MNSGSCEMWLYDLSIYCGCILVLTSMSFSIKFFDIMVRIVVRLGFHGDLQVLKILIIVNVFPQMYMDFLEMKYVLMIKGDLFD